MTTFQERVRAIVRNIPKGQVRTYGQVAKAAGYPGAARAVGGVMRANHDRDVPCHRVVRGDGTIGEYNRPGGTAAKIARLTREGVRIVRGRVSSRPRSASRVAGRRGAPRARGRGSR